MSLLSPKGTSPIVSGDLGLVLSGGGSRAAYQVGALRALAPELEERGERVSVIVGSSIGAVNTVILAACARGGLDDAVSALETLWHERTFGNTFTGSPTRSFLRALQVAVLRYFSPLPGPTSIAIFNPTPLRNRIDDVIAEHQGSANAKHPPLKCAGITVTVEGKARRPLLFVSSETHVPEERLAGASFAVSYIPKLTAAHGLASAALPSVLPPVKFNLEAGEVSLVDGGICDNVPVDPAVRLGASRVIVIETSGRRWWCERYGLPQYSRSPWEVPAGAATYCFCPKNALELTVGRGLGEVLKEAVGRRTSDFMSALGPTWPIFRVLKHRMGEELAYEVISYVALHPAYTDALIELGYQEMKAALARDLPATGFELTPVTERAVA